MSAPEVLMAVGAVGAMVPLLVHRRLPWGIGIAHVSMAVLMTTMVVAHVPGWMYPIGAIGLIAQAFRLVGRTAAGSASRLCVVDLTATAVLLLAMPTGSGAATASTSHHHTGGSAGSSGPVVVLCVWLVATVILAATERRSPSKGAVAGSILMIIGMAPMAV